MFVHHHLLKTPFSSGWVFNVSPLSCSCQDIRVNVLHVCQILMIPPQFFPFLRLSAAEICCDLPDLKLSRYLNPNGR